MEPTIYKPSIYKGAGIYNGNSVYNGNGVYNDGESVVDNVIYETDFSNFDFVSKIDYPLKGEPQQYTLDSSAFELANIAIDGETYSSIHHTYGTKNIFTQFYNALEDVDLFSIEVKLYKHSLGSTSYDDWAHMQFWNESSKNIGSPSFYNEATPNGYGLTYNGNGNIVWTIPYTNITSDIFMPNDNTLRSVNGICVGGATIDKVNKKVKAFLKDKKFMIIQNITDAMYNRVSFWFGSNVNIYLLGIKITKEDIFEQKE